MEPSLKPTTKRPFKHLSSAPTASAAKGPSTSAPSIATTGGGVSKRRPKLPPAPIHLPPGHASFRLLCRSSLVGGVIGKSGAIVRHLQQETGARIRIDEPAAGCEEHVVLVVAPKNPRKRIKVLEEELEVSPAQEALIRVFDRVLEVEAEVGEGANGGACNCRILAATNQIGLVMGKGGKVIRRIRKESKAKVSVLPPEQSPDWASQSDQVIQITGDALAVKKALVSVSRCLQDSTPIDKAQSVHRPVGTLTQGTFPASHGKFPLHTNTLQPSVPVSSIGHDSMNHAMSSGVDRIAVLDQKKMQQEVVFKLLCSNDKVGGVIGKGGSIVKALENETGASINVGSTVAESEERVITISAMENPESRYSPAQKAAVLVFARSVEAGSERGSGACLDKGSSLWARLLIPSNQIGCLMGKGGAIIAEMRKVTGAGIRILGGDHVPKCASRMEEVVQINGLFANVQDGLFHVTGRLRENIILAKPLNGSVSGSYTPTVPAVSTYGRVETMPSGVYSPAGLSNHVDRETNLAYSMDHLVLSGSHDLPTSPNIWPSQMVSNGNSRAPTDVGRGLPPLRDGKELGSGSKSAVVTNTTIEILVPEHGMVSVYGENGNNLSRIRKISGATVIVHEPQPGARERTVVISGTPDQTQAAQSLLQAFVLSGQS
ncbi:KH domain-containing protein [Acorus gramineus]|uniref:KH domain-containing protein n=1 Tax=Acorus gramineus TaxID=55184 RepID=A0AAV9BK65_ACOGR|nr:KH domain-containing protein [Acorus gramineus]